jgi:hypothetical protein
MGPIMLYIVNYFVYGVKIPMEKIKYIILCFLGVVISNLSEKIIQLFGGGEIK